jgi:hypothetical protein
MNPSNDIVKDVLDFLDKNVHPRKYLASALEALKGNRASEHNFFYGMSNERVDQYMKEAWLEVETLAHLINYFQDLQEKGG